MSGKSYTNERVTTGSAKGESQGGNPMEHPLFFLPTNIS